MNHDELLQNMKQKILLAEHTIYPIYMQALLRVVELTNNLQDTESWQDDADYKNGYNNAMNDIRLVIEKELSNES